MPTATIAVKGTASEEFPADFGGIHFQHHVTMPARSDALTYGNAVIAQVREIGAQPADVREIKVRSLKVEEVFNSIGADPSGWSVHIAGEAYADTVSVSAVVASLIKVGVSISHISWHLDPEIEAEAHRAVRRQAVTDALQAANDFASALGGTVGDLITLADPGLLSAGSFANNPRVSTRAAGAFLASGTSSSTSWDENVDIDSYAVTVSASVEASYEVNLE
jgi:uncharacterized protein YggE